MNDSLKETAFIVNKEFRANEELIYSTRDYYQRKLFLEMVYTASQLPYESMICLLFKPIPKFQTVSHDVKTIRVDRHVFFKDDLFLMFVQDNYPEYLI